MFSTPRVKSSPAMLPECVKPGSMRGEWGVESRGQSRTSFCPRCNKLLCAIRHLKFLSSVGKKMIKIAAVQAKQSLTYDSSQFDVFFHDVYLGFGAQQSPSRSRNLSGGTISDAPMITQPLSSSLGDRSTSALVKRAAYPPAYSTAVL